MNYAVLHVSDFSLQAVLRLEPEAVGRPVALLDADRRNAVIVAANAMARAAGVALGQSSTQALAGCPGLVVRTPQPGAEEEAAVGLAGAAFSVSPMVEMTVPGLCTLEVTGLAAERREPSLRAAIARLARLELAATAGLGSTPLLARYAAQLAKPFLAIGNERAFLAPLPLAMAEPPPDIAAILANWGIATCGALTALAKADVTHRLGPAGLALWERAAGEASRPLRLRAPARTFAARLDCEHELETLEPVLFIVRRLVDRLAVDLADAGRAAGEITLELGLGDDTGHAHTIRLPEPATSADVLFNALRTYLETLRLAAPVVAVRVAVAPTRIMVRQHGLFDNALRDAGGFAETLARAAAIVGADRVGTPELADTHRPDQVSLATPAALLPSLDERFSPTPGGLVLRRYRPPLAATVELAGRTPAYVWTASARGTVKAIRGPWRGSGDWWQADRVWRREEWDLELDAGGIYRLAHTTPGGWWLEGEYD